MDYKNKYLKYKKKYLGLQDILTYSWNSNMNKNKQLIGGANCAKVGFHQHKTECVHDALLMILLYSDNFSERLQEMLDNPSVNIDNIIRTAIDQDARFDIFKPLQLEETDNSLLLTFGRQYIENIVERYNNEKLEFVSDKDLTSLGKQLRPYYPPSINDIKERKLPKTYRQDSVNYSLSCNYSSYKLTNINIIDFLNFTYTHNMHGSNYYNILNNISLINYYLVNYIPNNSNYEVFSEVSPDISLKMKKYQFLSTKITDLIYIFHIKELENISLDKFPEIINMIRKEIYKLELNIKRAHNLLGILLNIEYKEILEGIKSRPMHHTVGFLTCNNKGKFYDNEQIIEKEDTHTTELYSNPEDMHESKDTFELIQYPEYYMKEERPVMMDFDWKNYLIVQLQECEKALLKIKFTLEIGKITKENVIISIKNVVASLSRLFQKDNPNRVGQKNIDKYIITSMHFIYANDINSMDSIEDEYIKANIENLLNTYTDYTNDRTYNLLSKLLLKKPEYWEDVFSRCLKYKNYVLIGKLLEDTRFPIEIKFEKIYHIIMDIINLPYNDHNMNLINILLKHLPPSNETNQFKNDMKLHGIYIDNSIIYKNNNSFLKNYTKIINSGQQNCGIYLSNDKKRIIKCDSVYNKKLQITLDKINSTYPNYKIFPNIYNIYEYNNNVYTEMEKFEGDLTQYLYEILPKNILLNMPNLIDAEKDFYYKLFNSCIPKTFNNNDEYSLDISDYDKLNELLMNPYFANYKVFIKKYEEFIKIYMEQFNNIFTTIQQQIYRLILLLINIGLNYIDYKLDNFAFNYSDTNEHLGIQWSNNKLINGKYLNVSILDWDSGLRNYDFNIILPKFNTFIKYGQYYINLLKNNNLYDHENLLKLDTRLLDFLKKEYKLEIKELNSMNTLDDFNKFTHIGNKVIVDININLPKLYMKYLLEEYSIKNIKANKFYIEKKPIIDYDGSRKYLIKCDTLNQIKYKNPKYQQTLLYFLFKTEKIYLVNFNKTTKKYEQNEVILDQYSNYLLINLIRDYCTIVKPTEYNSWDTDSVYSN